MIKLPEADRYYLMAFHKEKTHLLYFKDGNAKVVCMPFVPYVEMCSESEGYGEATRTDAEHFDQYYNELTCPTCLNIARGYKDIPSQIIQGSMQLETSPSVPTPKKEASSGKK